MKFGIKGKISKNDCHENECAAVEKKIYDYKCVV